MDDPAGTPGSGEHSTQQTSNVFRSVQAGRGRITHFDRMVLAAARVHRTLERALPTNTEARAELDEVITEIMTLLSQVAEWARLHHLLHEVLVAFAPFHAGLTLIAKGGLSAPERQVLLQNWRPCQDRLDLLVGFAEDVEHIGHPFQQAGLELRGERWAVEPVALRLLIEDALKEDNPSSESLYEMAGDFDSACRRHLALADRRLMAHAGQSQRLSICLLRGIV